VILNQAVLERIASTGRAGDVWPYDGGRRDDIISRLQTIVAALTPLDGFTVDARFGEVMDDSLASAQVYFVPTSARTADAASSPVKQNCLALFLSAVAPVAAFCPAIALPHSPRTSHAYGLNTGQLGLLPPGQWESAVRWVIHHLGTFNLSVLGRDDLVAVLPEGPKIPQHYRGGKWFEVLFF